MASASIEGLQTKATFEPGGDVHSQGRIGSIHLLDLAEETILAQDRSNRIFALGESREPDLDFATIFALNQGRGLDAFSFTLERRNMDIALQLDTASLCYLHVPPFLVSFIRCIDSFKDWVSYLFVY